MSAALTLNPVAVTALAAEAYQPGRSLGEAFGALLKSLLPSFDILQIDPMDAAVRALAAGAIRTALDAAPELKRLVLERNRELVEDVLRELAARDPGGVEYQVLMFDDGVGFMHVVAFDGTALPRSVVTGAPVRAAVVASARPDDGARSAARVALGLPGDRLVVAVVGGSLGSKRLNEAVVALAALWAQRADIALYHVVGRRDSSWAADAAPDIDTGGLCYIQVAYEERMGLFYQAADIVVARAGANTVAELAVVGVPALLVPLPGAPGDHQSANAAVLERVGAAVVIPDAQCRAPRLADEIDALASDPGRLGAMRAAASAVGRPDAVSAVVRLARAYARTRPGAPAAHAR